MVNHNEKTAIIYARFSSHAQNEQSIEGQLKACYDFAGKQGYNVVAEYIEACDIIEPTRRSLINQGFQRVGQLFSNHITQSGLTPLT